MKNFINNFAAHPSDSEDLKLLKKIILIISVVCMISGLIWAGMFYTFFGMQPVVLLPISFFFIVGGAIILAHYYKKYKILVFAQLFCITWIGAFIQWNLGTIHQSGAVLVWTFLGPIGAMLFYSKKQAYIWYAMFLFILVVTVIYEPFLSDNRFFISKEVTKVFYIMNIGVTSIIVLLSVLYFFNGIEKEKRKINVLLKSVSLKNKEITDSIIYTSRIQKALLPTLENVKNEIPNSFIYYQPKDIVSGDFYWMYNMEDYKIFAVADCTGHGVPGAMVSVICIGALNRAIRDYHLIKPSQILNKTREIVIAEFKKSGENVYDGMDIALCSLRGNKLEFSGAHNSLWLIRNNKLKIYKADALSISNYPLQDSFTNYEIDVLKGDMLYIFTDGLRDQFGGEKNKRLKISGFKELILKIHQMPLQQQKDYLNTFLNEWKGNNEQLDDICIMGIKI